ncbi:hypothetical protein QBC33DRAFT_546281 [Phialemonium atrogriseum]|uniref:Calcineurin-like phosphoesterase domain-containing protein n=1 Tax=Phialemonium atrogriseum TaxID=1093897 RepID=A0AAJ0FL88_9PEZI|nr:uncharacterized protein QBC33DRAFT_546281 [Phialemonium atrogriseum]KAK1764865.1 hypothetical protein QBC33DRAFT_546281 [Phialemonium atrogriseum]
MTMSPVLFQILSDLHLETHPSYHFPIKQAAPYLALLGDIGHVADDGLFDFLETQLRRYWTVFFLLGNHEPIHTSWTAAKSRVRGFSERMERLRSQSTMGRFVFLDHTRYDVNDTITILGCTLFSRVSPEQAMAVGSRFVDFRQINNWMVQDHVDAHLSDLKWLNAQVSEISRTDPQRQIVIFTHYSPTCDPRAMDERHSNSPVTSGFATDLSAEECWMNRSVALWAFGHTHFSCDFVDDLGKNIIANQKGYRQTYEKDFDMTKIFLVGRDAKPGHLLLGDR